MHARHAAPTDDLTTLWPKLREVKVNHEQVLVAVDEEHQLHAGVLCWDGGHDYVYVGEFVVRPAEDPKPSYVAAKLLMQTLMMWARQRGRTHLLFVSADNLFMANALRSGAELLGTVALFKIEVKELWKL